MHGCMPYMCHKFLSWKLVTNLLVSIWEKDNISHGQHLNSKLTAFSIVATHCVNRSRLKGSKTRPQPHADMFPPCLTIGPALH
jgi:hypothetical protein